MGSGHPFSIWELGKLEMCERLLRYANCASLPSDRNVNILMGCADKALPWPRPHTEQTSQRFLLLLSIILSVSTLLVFTIYWRLNNFRKPNPFEGPWGWEGRILKPITLRILTHCTAGWSIRMQPVHRVRANEYKRLNFLLPICSMPSDHPTQQCSCIMSSYFPTIRCFCFCCKCCQVCVHLLRLHCQQNHVLLRSTKSTSCDRVSGFLLIPYKQWLNTAPYNKPKVYCLWPTFV